MFVIYLICFILFLCVILYHSDTLIKTLLAVDKCIRYLKEIYLNKYVVLETDLPIQSAESQVSENFESETVPFEMITEDAVADIQVENGETDVLILVLEDNVVQDRTLYRLKKGWQLEFRLGPSLFGHRIKVYTNAPAEGKQFVRNIYQHLKWCNPAASDDSICCRLKLNIAGSYHYYFTYDNSNEKKGSGYFIVDPVLPLGNKTLPLDCMQCITVLSKNLGPFSAWDNKLRIAKESGYNVIHFTPIQELGGSNSAYSIQNQHKVNKTFKGGDLTNVKMEDIISFTQKLRTEWKILSICDIVLNHTANESRWLQEHPECTYNMVNCPYLRPAYILDIALHNFSVEVKKGLWEMSGVPPIINNEHHLAAMRHILLETVLPKAKIHQMFMLDTQSLVTEFMKHCRMLPPPVSDSRISKNLHDLKIIYDPQYRRLSANVNIELALEYYNIYRNDSFDEETRLQKCAAEFKTFVDNLNNQQFNDIQDCLVAAVDACLSGIKYFRVQSDGPRWTEITKDTPLFLRYFTDYNDEASEDHMYSENGCYIMAHNGWVINHDPLNNFADPGSKVYLRRELIAWGDSVKLRYGNKPEDCPYVWDHMRRYVEETARAFDGIRLDNCHSTPIHVAEYMLDAARRIRPDLYVVAELFTNSPDTDNIFVNRLGITSLIRESMSAWDSHELGRLVYRYGGEPVGAFMKPKSRLLIPSIAHALFLDLSHDNPSPVEKRSVFDLLPSSALLSMACCASGSTMGYDQLVPHHINVVTEKRTYLGWSENEINANTGIIAAKKALNDLHYYLGKEGYSQVFVDQINEDVVCITRHNEYNHQSVILLAYTAFHHPNPFTNITGRSITVSGVIDSILIEAHLKHKNGDRYAGIKEFQKDPNVINGLTEYKLDIKTNFSAGDASMILLALQGDSTIITMTEKFKPGSVVALKFVPTEKVVKALKNLHNELNLGDVLKSLTLADLNKVLYCCDAEDGGCYNIPNFGPLVYCGLQGIMSLMENIAVTNDLGHPVCSNLRQGRWLLDYTIRRMQNKEGTKRFGEKLERLFKPLDDIPHYLVPSYFYFIVSYVYKELTNHAITLMSTFVQHSSEFCKGLALGSVQFGGIVDSSPLPPLSKSVIPSGVVGTGKQFCVTLSAGLPHFATGYMRNWGRDTFISLRGLFLLTGRFEEARYIILAYGGCLRHGLIPNLLDGGINPRYNCRDAVWWWLYTIKSYVLLAPNGVDILKDKVNRLYPTDDSQMTSMDQPLFDVIQEAMTVHFQGLCFRERNAGTQIDAHMKSAGFDNQIGVHPATGFVFGGNEWNCGTWMDKMGSSDKAGNRGKPATSRDGSPIEIIALSKSTITWLAKLNNDGVYPYSEVVRKNKDGIETRWSYTEWAQRIQENFEKHFWIPASSLSNESNPKFIHHRGIYKDVFGSAQVWPDYQLRCNFPVAMIVAPELFTPNNAWIALETAKKYLLGPLGMKTLDSEDWAYNGYYDNSNDSTDYKTAHGFNYHQGPEWLWPVGYYLRARLYFALKIKNQEVLKNTIFETKSYLSNHYTHLKKSSWRGLPELTNKDGQFCPFSCPTQAWSMASILEVVKEISDLEEDIES